MHNNYYFLRQLSKSLERSLTGFTLVSCFSQEKDELVIEFNNGENSFFLKCSILPDLQCLSFPDTFHRARKNSVDLFREIVMKKVTGIRQFENERSFGLQLEQDYLLVFKMHGPQANVVLFGQGAVVWVFRHHLPADRNLRPELLDRNVPWNEQDFLADPRGAPKRFFTFGSMVWGYLDDLGFASAPPNVQWKMIEEVRRMLENPRYYLVEDPDRTRLSLLPPKFSSEEFKDPVKAINTFFYRFLTRSAFVKERGRLLAAVRGRMAQGRTYLEKARQRLEELNTDTHYTLWADLVMANLHRLSPGLTEADLEDFHDPGRHVHVRLRKDLTPQRNAEVFYRKAKNQAIEKQKLTEASTIREKALVEWEAQEAAILSAQRREDLQAIAALFNKQDSEKEKRISLPYQEHRYGGFTILVGKNAAANDALTFHHAHKEDLWLHARDVAGSHVVIRHQAGKTFPKDVVGFAASLAAYHSKRRNESLCPVSATSAKYVRKRKGDPPGMVDVQREKVIMAEPWRRKA